MSETREYTVSSLGSKDADDFAAQQGELQEYDERKLNGNDVKSDTASVPINGDEDKDYPSGKEIVFIGQSVILTAQKWTLTSE